MPRGWGMWWGGETEIGAQTYVSFARTCDPNFKGMSLWDLVYTASVKGI